MLHLTGGQMLPGESGNESSPRLDKDLTVPTDSVDPEEKVTILCHPVGPDVLGYGVGHAVTGVYLQRGGIGGG